MVLNGFVHDSDTIAAIATPVGSNGIGIIRISGAQAITALDGLFFRHIDHNRTFSAYSLSNAATHLMQYGYILNPKTRHIIDEVLVVVMRAPHSYTCENVVEVQSHSGAVILSTILRLILNQGVRLAEAGEFTKRAFLNGRIDLSQAEAVAEMVSVKTESALSLAATQLSGKMREIVGGIEFEIDQIRVNLEGDLEFGDNVEVGALDDSIQSTLHEKILKKIEELIARYDDSHVMRDGIRLDIVGKPNVGKSSLLNRLLDQEKAIVTAIPGTTRDPVEGYTAVGGISLIVTDTAGLHETNDPVELAGIQKTRESLEKSDVLLFVVDGSEGIDGQDMEIWKNIQHKNTILVANKMDLKTQLTASETDGFYPVAGTIHVSAKTGEGLDLLKKCIKEACLKRNDIEPGRTVIPNLRHRKHLEKARSFIHNALGSLQNFPPNELVMDDLNRAKKELHKITGGDGSDDLLDQIFGRFCIGK